jgi:hypothetical protein
MKEGFQETETKTQMQLHGVHKKIHQQPKKKSNQVLLANKNIPTLRIISTCEYLFRIALRTAPLSMRRTHIKTNYQRTVETNFKT